MRMHKLFWIVLYIFAVGHCKPLNDAVTDAVAAVDAVKKDFSDLAERLKGSALFETFSKAINISMTAIDAVVERSIIRDDNTILHITDDLTLKRLYQLVSAHHQLREYSHIIIYWVPYLQRSKSALENIATLYDLFPRESIVVLDLNNFEGVEREVMGSNSSSSQKYYTLLAAKVHQMRFGVRGRVSASSNFLTYF
jgi:hypothetical protein